MQFAMGSSKLWRSSGRMPVSVQVGLLFVSLILVLSSVSYQMLPTSTWSGNIGNLLLGVSWGASSTDANSTSSDARISNNFTSPAPAPAAAAATGQSDVLSAPGPSVENLGSIESLADSPAPETSNEAGIAVPAPSVTVDAREKFMVPILSFQVGAGNQFMEYVSAAVIAQALNRTLCLTPFFPGPSRHTGRVVNGLAWEDRFEVSSLSRFTRVATIERCLQECNYTLDDRWMLKTMREPIVEKWLTYPSQNDSMNLQWDYVKWTKTEDIAVSLGNRNDRCVGMMGLFPGLRWRGAFLAISAFLRPAPRIIQLANKLQSYAVGMNTSYLAVHWRFEESECGPHNIGLCFMRCQDGSVIDTGLPSPAQEWRQQSQPCNRDGHFLAVTLHPTDILDAIQERAGAHNVTTVYFATDGWMRGSQGVRLVRETVLGLRERGLAVVGLWKVPGLPNFSGGEYFDPVETLGKGNQDLNGAQIALVEQELCSRAVSFLGSGPSTWSLSVFRVRLARRQVKVIVEAAERDGTVDLSDPRAVDRLVSETLLKDQHPAGLHCRYLRYMEHYRVNETAETSADEYPDGWLDMEACEGRIGRGGRCEVAKCY